MVRFSDIAPEVIFGALRTILASIGGVLIAWGARDATQSDEWNGILQVALGVLTTGGIGVWSWRQKRQARLALVVAAGSPVKADAAIVRAAASPTPSGGEPR